MLNKKEAKKEAVTEDTQEWVCADCKNPLPTPTPAACPRCGSTAVNPK